MSLFQDASEAFESPRSYYSAEGSEDFHSVHSQSFHSDAGEPLRLGPEGCLMSTYNANHWPKVYNVFSASVYRQLLVQPACMLLYCNYKTPLCFWVTITIATAALRIC